MKKTQAADQTRYRDLMTSIFSTHYKDGKDVWSKDESLTESTKIALEEMKKIKPHAKYDILDIGCGNGRHFYEVAPDANSYMGVDLIKNDNWKNVEQPHVKFAEGDFLTWANSTNETYDLILDNGCFHHQHEQDAVPYLKSIVKLVKPGGLFSVVVWAEPFREGNIDEDGRYHFYYSPESLTELLESLGFQAVMVRQTKALIGKLQLHVVAQVK